jgi:hypothetical protein
MHAGDEPGARRPVVGRHQWLPAGGAGCLASRSAANPRPIGEVAGRCGGPAGPLGEPTPRRAVHVDPATLHGARIRAGIEEVT